MVLAYLIQRVIPLTSEPEGLFLYNKVRRQKVGLFVSVQLLVGVEIAHYTAVEEEQSAESFHLVQPGTVHQMVKLEVQRFQKLRFFVQVV